MPTIVASLGRLDLYSWVFASYMLFAAVTMPIHGKLSDIYGRKRFFFVGVILFVLGSVLSGLSRDITHLIAFRALQGVGGGALFAIPYTVLGVVYPPGERGRAIGYASAVWGFSSIVGPLLGYLLVELLGWRWVFYLSVPVGAASIALIHGHLEESTGETDGGVDYLGSLTLSVGVGASLLGIQLLEGGSLDLAALLVGLGAIGLAAFYFAEKRAREPVLPIEYFRDPVFLSTNAAAFLSSAAIFSAFTYAPLYLQSVRGGAEAAAMAVFPVAIGWSFTSMASGRILPRTGERRLVVTGGIVMTAAFGLGTLWSSDTPLPLVMLNLFVMGVGMGALTPPLLTSIQNYLGTGRMGQATSSQQFFRNVGGTVGVVALGLVMITSMRGELSRTGSVSGIGEFREAVMSGSSLEFGGVMAHGLTTVFAASAVICLAVVLLTRYIPSKSSGGRG